MNPVCETCSVAMRRVGLEQTTPQGVCATFECPVCHARVQKIVHGTPR